MMTPAQLKQARYAFAWGASVAQVARLTGCTVLTIALAQARGELKARPVPTPAPIARVDELSFIGLSLAQSFPSVSL